MVGTFLVSTFPANQLFLFFFLSSAQHHLTRRRVHYVRFFLLTLPELLLFSVFLDSTVVRFELFAALRCALFAIGNMEISFDPCFSNGR